MKCVCSIAKFVLKYVNFCFTHESVCGVTIANYNVLSLLDQLKLIQDQDNECTVNTEQSPHEFNKTKIHVYTDIAMQY